MDIPLLKIASRWTGPFLLSFTFMSFQTSMTKRTYFEKYLSLFVHARSSS